MDSIENQTLNNSLFDEYRKIVPNAAWDSPTNPKEIKRRTEDFLGYSARKPVTVSGHTGV